MGNFVMPEKKAVFEYLVANTTDKLVEYLMHDYQMPLIDALDHVYRSKTFALLEDKETELYIQSPAYVYERLTEEIGKELIQP